MTTLSDQTTLVTGANRGLGREFVDQFLARGAAKVYAAARDPRSITMHDPQPERHEDGPSVPGSARCPVLSSTACGSCGLPWQGLRWGPSR